VTNIRVISVLETASSIENDSKDRVALRKLSRLSRKVRSVYVNMPIRPHPATTTITTNQDIEVVIESTFQSRLVIHK
jgi:hypothetical protein